VSWPLIETVEIFCVQLPYREAFTIALGTSTASWNLVVRVEAVEVPRAIVKASL